MKGWILKVEREPMDPINIDLNENDAVECKALAQGPGEGDPKAMLKLGPVAIIATNVMLKAIREVIDRVLAAKT